MFKIFLALALGLTVSVQATPVLVPTDRAPVCLKRVYSQEHMTKNSKQLVSSMYVKINFEKDYSPNMFSAKIVGQHNGKLWANEPTCQTKTNGRLNCFVECDGGAFDLNPSPRYANAVNWTIAKDYYFPLFLNRFDDDSENPVESIEFKSEDKDNSIYRLYPADVEECDKIIEEVGKHEPAGC